MVTKRLLALVVIVTLGAIAALAIYNQAPITRSVSAAKEVSQLQSTLPDAEITNPTFNLGGYFEALNTSPAAQNQASQAPKLYFPVQVSDIAGYFNQLFAAAPSEWVNIYERALELNDQAANKSP